MHHRHSIGAAGDEGEGPAPWAAIRSGKPAVVDVIIDRTPRTEDFRADKREEYRR